MTQKKIKPAKPGKIQNTAYIEGMREIRRSNAAGTHDNRPNRERSRQDALRSAISRSRNENEE